MPSAFNFSTLDEKLQKNECRTKKIMWNYKLLFKKFTF